MKIRSNLTMPMKSLPLKIISCILGYSCWNIFSENQLIHRTIVTPVSFYNISEQIHIDSAPETLSLVLFGKRKDFNQLDITQLAYHINGNTLSFGTNHLIISTENLFLPESISIAKSNPSVLTVKTIQAPNHLLH